MKKGLKKCLLCNRKAEVIFYDDYFKYCVKCTFCGRISAFASTEADAGDLWNKENTKTC